MKFLLVVSAAVALSVAAPPTPGRPSARLILLPAAVKTPTKPEAPSAKQLDSGEYYVLTPEGKLQMVKYTTAALQKSQPAQVARLPEPFAQLRPEYLQYPGFQAQSAPQSKEDYKKPEVADFEATLEYRDVKPIPAPIYAYNPEPLIRILRK